MQPWVVPFLVAFAVVDTIVVLWVLKRARARRAGATPTFLELRKLMDAVHPRIEALVRGSWNGDVATLPPVLAMALDEAAREARARRMTVDREVLKKLLENSLARHGVAGGAQLQEALRQVA